MPTTKKHLSKLVTRLCAMPSQDKDVFFVDPQDIRDNLGHTLERYAQSDDEATRIVEWLVFERSAEQRRFRPQEWEIPEAARVVRERELAANTPRGCVNCEGTGCFYVKKLARDPITGVFYDADCQQLCDCALGKHLAERKGQPA